jgi:hypothetical protein
VGYAAQIDDDSLDAVALAFNLGLELLHLVAVKGIRDILTGISKVRKQRAKSHRTLRMLIVAILNGKVANGLNEGLNYGDREE